MRSFWSDPYLWIHLAGVAALPIFLEICFLGLAVGDPVLPLGLELLLIAAVGIAPIVWMQWQRPFYIFSLMAIALKPEQLTVDQRKLLRLFKSPINRGLAAGVPVFLFWVLWQLYRYAPIASDITPLAGGARGWGLLLAAIAFLASNLFLQVPVSVASVLLTREVAFATTEPYPVEQISADFTVLGWRVQRILPDVIAERPKALSKPIFLSPIAASQKSDPSPVQFPSTAAVSTAPPTESTVADATDGKTFIEVEPLEVTPLAESESLTEVPLSDASLSEASLAETSLVEPESLTDTATETAPIETAPAESLGETALAETPPPQTESLNPSEPVVELPSDDP